MICSSRDRPAAGHRDPADFTLSLSGRTAERRRAEIRALLGFREATVADAELLEGWLREQAAAVGLLQTSSLRFWDAVSELSIEPPADDRIDRIIRAAIHAHDERSATASGPSHAGDTGAAGGAVASRANESSDRLLISPGNGACVVAAVAQRSGEAELGRRSGRVTKLELVRESICLRLFDGVFPMNSSAIAARRSRAPYDSAHPEAASSRGSRLSCICADER